MDIKAMEQRMKEKSNYSNLELNQLWKQTLQGNQDAFMNLKYYYMNLLYRIKPLYQHVDDSTFFHSLDKAVTKALERGIKFQIEDYHSYMPVASETYFKSFFNPESDSLHVPSNLLRSFSRLEDIFHHIPELKEKDEQTQIQLISKGFEYPLFETRLLYYSYLKWKQNQLRQVDIDLTVTLLPGPQRVEWEIFYEKQLKDIEDTIKQEMKNGEVS
ncbi:hypothetical protein [Tepidibacillus fermentans]|uniref:Uncharacterized protein n=1 Tax=Tepidibacillus fermentans TaxID=1281767 RepID=A0A4R3KH92_9BACI|nr:hypothetical protein [Tepidibacillus fermentans]TCS82565.1 hypothetical protein EDD72_10855 [Tepidibacillus fermentans]